MYCGFHVTHAPHTCSVSQPLPSHVSRSRNRHQKVAEIDVCTPRLVMSLLLSCQLVPNYLNHWPVWDFTLHTHPTHILSVNNYHHMCLDQGIWTEKTLKLTFIHQDSTCRSFYWFFQLVSNCFNHWGIGDSTIHRYPTRIKSPNHWHRMCLDHGVDTQKSLKWTFTHMGSRFRLLDGYVNLDGYVKDRVSLVHPGQSNFETTLWDTADHFWSWNCDCRWRCRGRRTLHASVWVYLSDVLGWVWLHAQSTVQKSVSLSMWAIWHWTQQLTV